MGHSAATHPGRALSPLSSQPEESWAKGPPKVMKNGSGSATTVAGSAALPFVISTGGVMGLRPTQGDEKTGPVQQLLLLEAPPSPLSSRPEKSWAFGPPKVMKNSFCSATTLNGSAALPFVISTGAPKERSGEICGVSDPSLGWRSQGDEKPVLFRNDYCWKRRPPLCHLDRSSEGA